MKALVEVIEFLRDRMWSDTSAHAHESSSRGVGGRCRNSTPSHLK